MSEATPRERMLAAVVQVALAEGIADKSLRAIAAAAGTSHRMLIHHFGSREGLLVAVIKDVEERQRAIMAEVVTADPDQEPGTQEMRFWRHLRSPELAAQERLFFEVYGQALQGRPWARPLLDGIVTDWVSPVAALLAAEGVGPDLAQAVARLYLAAGRGLLLDVLATGDHDGVDAAMGLLVELVYARLAPGAAM